MLMMALSLGNLYSHHCNALVHQRKNSSYENIGLKSSTGLGGVGGTFSDEDLH